MADSTQNACNRTHKNCSPLFGLSTSRMVCIRIFQPLIHKSRKRPLNIIKTFHEEIFFFFSLGSERRQNNIIRSQLNLLAIDDVHRTFSGVDAIPKGLRFLWLETGRTSKKQSSTK